MTKVPDKYESHELLIKSLSKSNRELLRIVRQREAELAACSRINKKVVEDLNEKVALLMAKIKRLENDGLPSV